MNDRSKKLEAIFHDSSELRTPEEREHYLKEACAGDENLRREVEALLSAAAIGNDLFHSVEQSSVRFNDPASEQPGGVIGRYKLLQKIGEGGMGVVYLAEQEQPVRRKVALKIIKLGMDTRQVVARFEAERQALALMDSPHIAQVLDAGATEAGRPYFAMELVQGVPITEFCEANQLSIPERLHLFIPVCQAIQSAHQKGIIHRDIKPSNVLVTMHHGAPHPMVIDFGVAKAIDQKLTEKTLFTNFATMIGTPAYMSPEQAEMSKLDVDTRSDVYSLGVLLYELLTGTTPFPEKRLRSVAYGEMQRIIAEEAPERPSKVVERALKLRVERAVRSSNASKATLSSQLRSLSTDLDWIILKCLEKDRGRRYDTANALAADIQAYLKQEPVIARPPTTAYRFQKFVRRNKLPFAAAMFALVALLGAVVVSSWQASARKAALVDAHRTLYIAQMKAVQLAWDRGDIAEAQTLLRAQIPKKGDEDLRGFEWRYYWKQCRDESRLTITNDFPKQILCVASSPDGSLLVWGDEYGDIHVRRSGDWKPVFTGLRHFGQVRALDFSRDGRWLVSGGGDRLIRIWELTSGQEIKSLLFTNEWGNAVGCVRLSPDGSLIAAGDSPGKFVRVWDWRKGEVVASFEGPLSENRVVDFSPEGSHLVFNNGDDKVHVWDVRLRSIVREFSADQGGLGVLRYSPDGTMLASSGPDGSIKLWATKDWSQAGTLFGHKNTVTAVSFSRDGRTLASSSVDRAIKVWDLNSRRELKTLYGHLMRVNDLTILPDGAQIASAGHNTVKIWDLPVSSSKPMVESEPVLHGRVWSTRFSPDCRVFATIGADINSERRLWEMDSGKLIAILPAQSHAHAVGMGDFSRDSKFFVTPGGRNGVAVWNSTNGMLVSELSTGTNQMETLTFSRTDELLAGGRYTDLVYRWDRSFKPLPPLTGYDGGVMQLQVSPNGEILAAWCPAGQVLLRELKSLKFLPPIPQASRWPAMAFTLDSKLLTIESGVTDNRLENGGNVRCWNDIWEVGTSRKVDRLNGANATFSGDGRFLATLGNDSSIELWDVRKRRLAQRLTWVGGAAGSISFSPDSQTLVSCDSWVTLRFWNLRMFREVLSLSPKGGAHTAFSPDGNALVVGKPWRGIEFLRASSFAEVEAELAAEATVSEATDE